MYQTVSPTLAASLELKMKPNPFYMYYFNRCLSKLAESVLRPYSCEGSSIIQVGCVPFLLLFLEVTKLQFCKSTGKHLWNKENCFSFHFESAFCYWDNQTSF